MSVADRGPISVLRALVTEIQEKRITFLAASLAYYAFASLIPLLLLAISIATIVGGPSLADRITEAAGGSLPQSVSSVITDTLSSSGAASASLGIGLVFLLWSAIKIFRGMDIAFSEVYGEPGPQGIVDQVTDALVTLLGIVLAVVVTIVIGAVVSFVQQSSDVLTQVGLGFLQNAIGYLAGFVSIIGLCLAFYPLYYFLPTDDVTLREAIPGTIFAAVGWTALQTGFRLYAAQSGSSAYGIIGAALLILTFLYFGGLIILIGVAVNAVLAGRTGENADTDSNGSLGADTNSDGDSGTDSDTREDEREASAGSAGETNRNGGVFRTRVKERAQSIIDEQDAERDENNDGDGDGDRRLVTDGGVETESTEASETGSSDAADAPGTSGSAGTTGATESSSTDGTATDRQSAVGSTGTGTTGSGTARTGSEADGEYTIEEEYTLQREIERLRAELDAFELEVEERVVERDELESDLKSYVRSRVRSGKARGWGPYLVLLYGTIMTVAIAFGDALAGGWAVLGILIIFLSTLGLYVLMVLVGLGISALSVPGKLRNTVQSFRS